MKYNEELDTDKLLKEAISCERDEERSFSAQPDDLKLEDNKEETKDSDWWSPFFY